MNKYIGFVQARVTVFVQAIELELGVAQLSILSQRANHLYMFINLHKGLILLVCGTCHAPFVYGSAPELDLR